MADKKILLEILVNGEGKVSKATASVKGLGDAIDQTGQKTRGAAKAAETYHDRQKKGIIGTANQTKSFSKLASTIGSGGGGLVGAYAGLAANAFALGAAFQLLSETANQKKIIIGLDVSSARLGTTLSITAKKVKELTGNTISLSEAYVSVAQASASGFSPDTIERLTKGAKDAASALGRDVPEAMQRVIRGTTKLEPELLDELGVIVKLTEASRKYAIANNKNATSLTQFEKTAAYTSAVIEEMERKFGGISDDPRIKMWDTYSESLAKAKDYSVDFFGTIASLGIPVIRTLTDNMATFAGVAALFFSTIKNQVLGDVVSNASAMQRSVAKQTKELNKIGSKGFNDLPTRDKQGFERRLDGQFAGKGLAPAYKQIDQLKAKFEQGTIASKDFNKSINSIGTYVKLNERAVESATAGTKEYNKALGNVVDGKRRLVLLKELRQAHFQNEQSQLRANTAQLAASGLDRKSLGEIGKNLKSEYKLVRDNALANSNINSAPGAIFASGQTVGQRADAALNKASNAAKIAGANIKAFGAASVTAAKAAGTAFMNFIPTLGAILMVVGLLTMAYKALKDAMTSDTQKRLNEANEEYKTILDGVNESVAQYNKLKEMGITSSGAEIQALTLRANKLTEIGSKLEEIKAIEDESVEAKKGGPGAANALNKVYRYETVQSGTYTPGGGAAIERRGITLGDDLKDKLGEDRLKALSGVYNLVSSSQKSSIETRLKYIASMKDEAKAAKEADDLVIEQSKKHQELAAVINGLAENFKLLEESVAGYINTFKANTPISKLYDSIVNTTFAIERLGVQAKSGALDMDELGRMLQSIGPESRNLLGDVAPQLVQLEGLRDRIEQIQKLKAPSRAQQSELNNALVLEKNLSSDLLSGMRERFKVVQAIFRKQELASAQAKYQLGLESARFSKVSEILDGTGAGLIAQLESQEKSRAIQVQQLEIEKVTIEMLKTQAQMTINELKVKQASLQAEMISLDILKLQTEERRSQMEFMMNMMSIGFGMVGVEDPFNIQKIKDLQIQIDNISISIEEAQFGMQKLNDATSGIDENIAAILAQNLSEAEKSARALGENFKVAQKFLDQMSEYSGLLLDNILLVSKYNKTIRLNGDNLVVQAQELVGEYEAQRKSSASTLANLKTSVDIEKQLVSATKNNNALTAQELAAGNQSIANKQAEYENAKKTEYQKLRNLEISKKTELLELSMFDTRKEGIEWQQTYLDSLEKSVSASAKLAEASNDLLDSETRISRLKLGYADSDRNYSNEALKLAIRNAQQIKEEANIKLALIDAEYALLDAQKNALILELRSRGSILEAMGVYGAPIEQLYQTVQSLSAIDYSKIANAQKNGVLAEVKGANQAIREAQANSIYSKGNQSYASRAQQRRDEENERQSLLSQANAEMAIEPVISTLLNTASSRFEGLKEMELSVDSKGLTPIIEEIAPPLERIANDVSLIRKGMEGGPSVVTGGMTGNQAAVAAAKYIEKNYAGARVTELGGHGGNKGETGGHSKNSSHYTRNGSRAGDVNLDGFQGKNWEFNDKSKGGAKSKFDALALDLQSQGATVIWGNKKYLPGGKIVPYTRNDHKNHLHYEFPAIVQGTPKSSSSSAAKTVMASEYSSGQTGKVSTAKAMAATMPAGVDAVELTKKNYNAELASAPNAFKDTRFAEPIISDTASIASGFNALTTAVDGIKLTKLEELSNKIGKLRSEFEFAFEPLKIFAESLGEDGEIILAINSGIMSISGTVQQSLLGIDKANKVLADSSSTQDQQFAAKVSKWTEIGAMASSVLSSISSIMSASTNQRVRGIDAEIEAEKKRDGQSAASVKKVEELEKKKDSIQRKQFNINKKIMMAQAVIATATAIAQALTLGPIAGPIMAGVIGAMGLAQIALIAGTSYQSTSSKPSAANISKLSIGTLGTSVDLAKPNVNAGGELGYLNGSSGSGTNSSNYRLIGSAYGGKLGRGYGKRSFVVGETGAEQVSYGDEDSEAVVSNNTTTKGGDTYVIQISAVDGKSVEKLLEDNAAATVQGIRNLAQASGKPFLQGVDIKPYKGGSKV